MSMQVNRPVFDQGLVRNDRKGEQAVKPTAPTTDKVMDLTDIETLQAELNTQDVHFVRLKAKGEDVFLDVTRMSPNKKNEMITQLKNKVSGAYKLNEFDPETFFRLTGNQQNILFGQQQQQGPTAAIKDSQTVLNASLNNDNSQQQQIFALMNGSHEVLDKKNATHKVGDQKKPAEWYNGFQVKQDAEGNYQVSTYVSDLDKSERNYDLNKDGYKGRQGIEAYKQMLRDDFNFNGARTAIYQAARQELKLPDDSKKWTPEQRQQLSAKQEELFVASVLRKYAPQHPNLNDPQLKTLAGEVWSYVSTGANKSGGIDVGELQGLMNQLDPQIVTSGSNNNYSAHGKFTVTGADGHTFTLPKGDPYHGRGTILQTRHLLENFKAEGPVRLGFATPPPELQGYNNTLLLADNSASMGAHMQHLSGVIKAGGIEGSVTVGTFIDKDKPMLWSNAAGNSTDKPVSLKAEQAQKLLEQQGHAHVNFVKNKQEGPGAPGTAFKFEAGQSMNESGILAGISALEKQPPKVGSGPNNNQLILFTDETDASAPEDLLRLQELASQKGYDVKVVFTNRNNTFQIVNINSISPSLANDGSMRTKANSVENALDWSKIAVRQQARSYSWDATGIQ